MPASGGSTSRRQMVLKCVSDRCGPYAAPHIQTGLPFDFDVQKRTDGS